MRSVSDSQFARSLSRVVPASRWVFLLASVALLVPEFSGWRLGPGFEMAFAASGTVSGLALLVFRRIGRSPAVAHRPLPTASLTALNTMEQVLTTPPTPALRRAA